MCHETFLCLKAYWNHPTHWQRSTVARISNSRIPLGSHSLHMLPIHQAIKLPMHLHVIFKCIIYLGTLMGTWNGLKSCKNSKNKFRLIVLQMLAFWQKFQNVTEPPTDHPTNRVQRVCKFGRRVVSDRIAKNTPKVVSCLTWPPLCRVVSCHFFSFKKRFLILG